MKPGITQNLRAADLVALALLLALVALLFVQAPVGGAFAWSDAPRHALNGVFVDPAASEAIPAPRLVKER